MSEEYLNYWLKKTVKETPNDMELGNKVRELMSNNPKQSTNLKSEDINSLTLLPNSISLGVSFTIIEA